MLEFRSSQTDKDGRKRSVDGFVRRSIPSSRTRSESQLYDQQVSGDSYNSRPVGNLPKSRWGNASNTSSLTGKPALSDKPRKTTTLPVRKKSKVKKGLKFAGMGFGGLAICGLLVVGFIFGKTWLAATKIFQGGGNSNVLFNTNVRPESLRGEGDGRVNVLLVGISGGDRDGANLTDSIVIASLDPVARDVALLSIPRDLWVRVPNYWSMKINAAYASAYYQAIDNGSGHNDAVQAGFSSLEKTIEEHIGIPIHYHALVNSQAFRQGVDAVGGVDVNVEEDLYDYVIAVDNNGNPLIAARGQQVFDGQKALLYAQSRSSSNDFARGERQRQLLVALKDKVLSIGTFSNPSTISKLLDALGDNVSINATLGEIMRMYELAKDIPTESIVTVGLTDPPNDLVRTGNINDQSVVIPVAGQEDYSEIKAFIRNTLRDPFLKSENASIAVLNGTETAGMATRVAELLKSYGYNVVLVDNAPSSNYQNTVAYDRTNGEKKYTKSYLQRRIEVAVSDEPADGALTSITADFVIIVGQNEASQTTN